MCREECGESEHMAVCDVADIGEVEEIVVIADLELGLAFAIRRDHLGKDLDVAFADNACRADGACQECLWLAVGFEHCCFCVGLTRLSMPSTAKHLASSPLLLCSTLAARRQRQSATSRRR